MIVINTKAKEYGVSFFAGAILTFVFAPYSVLPVVFVSMVLLMLVIYRAQTYLDAFFRGLAFGYSFFLSSTYWIIYALEKNGGEFSWIKPLALIIEPLVYGAFIAFACLATFCFRRNKFDFSMAFIAFFTLFEGARAYFPLAFPWNFLAYSLAEHDKLLQIASVIGTYGATILVLTISALIFNCSIRNSVIAVALLSTVYLYGYYRLETKDIKYHENFVLRIVQPNIQQYHNFTPHLQNAVMRTLINYSNGKDVELINRDESDLPKVIIWPEGAIPYPVKEDSPFITYIMDDLPEHSLLMSGIDFYEKKDGHLSYYNAFLFADDDQQFKIYKKEKLVPFGEYVPFRQLLPFIDKLAQGHGDFSVGSNQSNILYSKTTPPFRPLICYEAVFPEIDLDTNDARWFVNLTNDFWFDDSIGVYQHFAMVKFKSVEYNIPVVRVVNSGITVLFNQFGLEEVKLPMFKAVVADVKLPIAQQANSAYWVKTAFKMLPIIIALLCLYRKFYQIFAIKIVQS